MVRIAQEVSTSKHVEGELLELSKTEHLPETVMQLLARDSAAVARAAMSEQKEIELATGFLIQAQAVVDGVSKAAHIDDPKFARIREALKDAGSGWTCATCLVIVTANDDGELVDHCPTCERHRGDAELPGYTVEPILESCPDAVAMQKKTKEELAESKRKRKENQSQPAA